LGLHTELFYAIVPTLFLCFLLICYPYNLLHFNVFYSCNIDNSTDAPCRKYYIPCTEIEYHKIVSESVDSIIESVDSICRDSADTQYNFSKSPKQLTYKPL